MSKPPDLFLPIDPSISPDDLSTVELGHAIRDARLVARRLIEQLKKGRLDPAGQRLLAVLQRGGPLAGQIVGATRDGAEQFLAYQKQLAAYEAEREAFLENLHRHITFLGSDQPPASWGATGWLDDPRDPAIADPRLVALSREAGQLILAAGVQGAGKTVFCSGLCEIFLQELAGLTSFGLGGEPAEPTGVALFHIEEQDRLPQQLAGLKPNPSSADLELLARLLGITGAPIGKLILTMPKHLIPRYLELLRPYLEIGLVLMPLRVRLGQLGQPGLEAALGAQEGARYVQRMLDDAQKQGDDLDIDRWHGFIDNAEDLDKGQKRSAHEKLRLLFQIASPPGGPGLWELYGPDALTIFFLGGPHMGLRDVVPLLSGLINAMGMPSDVHGLFKRVILVDEVNRLDGCELAWRAFTSAARMVRHKALTLGLFGQDLFGVPDELFGLAGMCAVFQLSNPRAFEHIRERVGGLSGHRFAEVFGLSPGEALVAARLSTDPAWRRSARRVYFRPLRCEHGGHTRHVA